MPLVLSCSLFLFINCIEDDEVEDTLRVWRGILTEFEGKKVLLGSFFNIGSHGKHMTFN